MAMGAVQVCVSIQTFYFKAIRDTPFRVIIRIHVVFAISSCFFVGSQVSLWTFFLLVTPPLPFLRLILMPNERFPLGVSLECNVGGGRGLCCCSHRSHGLIVHVRYNLEDKHKQNCSVVFLTRRSAPALRDLCPLLSCLFSEDVNANPNKRQRQPALLGDHPPEYGEAENHLNVSHFRACFTFCLR